MTDPDTTTTTSDVGAGDTGGVDLALDFQRTATKKRRHIYVSRELHGAVELLLPDYTNFSEWAEDQLWLALLEEHGRADVEAAIRDAKKRIPDDERLPEPQHERRTITG